MKRMDRLFAILMALQQRQETAQSLASKFEVSKRTILRDMEALAEMGVPLYALSGPNGGFRLMEQFHLPPLQLEAGEALAILFALQSLTQLQETPFNRERWTALDKIRQLIPEQTVRQLEPLLGKIGFEIPARSAYKTPNLSALLMYAAEGRWVRVHYRSERHRRWLHLKPGRVYTAHGFWYCAAYSPTHGEERTFRVDRMDSVEAVEPPQDAADTAGAAGKPQPRQPVRIRARLTYRGMMRVEQDEHVGEKLRALSDDEWELDFICPPSEWDWFVRFFYTLGLEAEVIEPESLRTELQRMAAQVGSRYEPNKIEPRNHAPSAEFTEQETIE